MSYSVAQRGRRESDANSRAALAGGGGGGGDGGGGSLSSSASIAATAGSIVHASQQTAQADKISAAVTGMHGTAQAPGTGKAASVGPPFVCFIA